jgi:hypothetical protein
MFSSTSIVLQNSKACANISQKLFSDIEYQWLTSNGGFKVRFIIFLMSSWQ